LTIRSIAQIVRRSNRTDFQCLTVQGERVVAKIGFVFDVNIVLLFTVDNQIFAPQVTGVPDRKIQGFGLKFLGKDKAVFFLDVLRQSARGSRRFCGRDIKIYGQRVSNNLIGFVVVEGNYLIVVTSIFQSAVLETCIEYCCYVLACAIDVVATCTLLGFPFKFDITVIEYLGDEARS